MATSPGLAELRRRWCRQAGRREWHRASTVGPVAAGSSAAATSAASVVSEDAALAAIAAARAAREAAA